MEEWNFAEKLVAREQKNWVWNRPLYLVHTKSTSTIFCIADHYHDFCPTSPAVQTALKVEYYFQLKLQTPISACRTGLGRLNSPFVKDPPEWIRNEAINP